MRTKYILITIGVLIVLGVLVVLFWPRRQAVQKELLVKSTDGSAELTLTDGALPTGQSVEDIRITKIEPSALPVTFENTVVRAAYTLEPDGVEFQKPVQIKVTLENVEEALADLLLLQSDGTVEQVTDVVVEQDINKNQVVVAGTITHFSSLVVSNTPFGLTMTDPGDHVVGESFWVKVRARVLEETWVMKSQLGDVGYTQQQTLEYPWKLAGFIVSSTKPQIVEPPKAADLPKEKQFAKDESYQGEARFTCVKPGEGFLNYRVRLDYQIRIKNFKTGQASTVDPGGVYNFYTNSSLVTKAFHCNPALEPTTNTSANSQPTNQMQIEVLVLDNLTYPAIQFLIEPPDQCDAEHYHALRENSAYAFPEYKIKLDSGGCGYGKVNDVTKQTLSVDTTEWETFQTKTGIQ